MADDKPILVVGIGASAGGLEALEGFFRRMPADTGLAFVLVTHMAHGLPSFMAEILARFSPIPVVQASEGMPVAANRVHVCPPDHVLTIAGDRLHLHAGVRDSHLKLIDIFLCSLADDRGEAAVGVLLSGAGTDGTLGIKAVKERGGLTLAQGGNGSGPLNTGMIHAAISAGVVDLVLPVESMAGRLADYARNFTLGTDAARREREASPPPPDARQAICQILLNQVGHDFSGYKENTFMRRVQRRMQVLQIDDVDRYVGRLREESDEVTLLFRDLLIGVTSFFRDPEAFQALEQQVIPRLFEGKGASEQVRVWVPGCATGEEVYSLAIELREHVQMLRNPPKVQLFATDIDEAALTVARMGRYPASLLENVSPQRLKRFFNGDDVSFAVNKELRDMCIFSSHSVVRDPPFSRIDLISCRNLLIYFGVNFQAHVLPVFHFALRPRGFLFLGTSENVSQHGDLFTAIDKKHRIFQKRDQVASPLQFSLFMHGGRPASGTGETRHSSPAAATSLRRSVESRVLERFAPAHVVVNREGDVVHYSARTGKYLEPAAGLPNRQLIAMARRGLRLDLRAALREAAETRRPAARHGLDVELDDRVQRVDVIVEPMADSEHDPLFLVLFCDAGPPLPASSAEAHPPGSGDRTAERLEHELRDTRERLQATIEEYETAVEELKSSNEELQSMNEELQSTNEELETSKEELQSVNEELQTVNAELNAKVDELDRAHADLRNVFDSTQIATIFLDSRLIIRSFTPAITSIFNLIASDRGRPLTDIVNHLAEGADLQRDIESVIDTGRPLERNVNRVDGSVHYIMRVVPYHGRNDVIDGVLVTFVDVTHIVEAEAHQRMLVEELNHRVRNMLTVIGAIATRTLASARSPDLFVDSFLGRLNSMAQSYSLVSREQWGAVALRDIVVAELQPHMGTEAARVQLEGPEVQLESAQALGLGLVFHELVTNAAKYGALCAASGQLRVSWAREPGQIVVQWHESGVPNVAPPAHRGFGMELIQRQLTAGFKGSASFDYQPDGLRIRLVIPTERLAPAT